jgi:hypothetical protein
VQLSSGCKHEEAYGWTEEAILIGTPQSCEHA